ncbi:hypothetical protein NA57DRAFT_75237 [Rhizodiscina lignyota]|uniref:C3H1-type domain-containing protein n=1 Tax=Rhizodiscina lignyota TaxID=1504668 RepID=A0A9P4M6V8_9PEZI|nr:hypothetical protein NA57DRAFT_75237 [Rhizodiscina lignyota]
MAYTLPTSGPRAQDGPKPQWVLSRGNGIFTPLVPVDELPSYVQLQGAPRVITLHQANGMTLLGEQKHTSFYVAVPEHQLPIRPAVSWCTSTTYGSSPESVSGHTFQAPGARIRQALHQKSSIMSRDIQQQHQQSSDRSLDVDARRAASATQSTNSNALVHHDSTKPFVERIASCNAPQVAQVGNLPYNQRPLPPSGLEPDAAKKEYCTHWIRTGECDYMQQGCLFKHEIPKRKKLEELGFRDVPKWWRDHQAVKLKRSDLVLTEAQEKNKSICAGMKSQQPGADDSDSEEEELLKTEHSLKPLFSAVPLPVIRPRTSIPPITVRKDSPTSSDNSLIDLDTPAMSRSSSPTTVIAGLSGMASSNARNRRTSATFRNSIFIPAGEASSSSLSELKKPCRDHRKIISLPPTKSKGLDIRKDADGFVHYFPRTEDIAVPSRTTSPHPIEDKLTLQELQPSRHEVSGPLKVYTGMNPYLHEKLQEESGWEQKQKHEASRNSRVAETQRDHEPIGQGMVSAVTRTSPSIRRDHHCAGNERGRVTLADVSPELDCIRSTVASTAVAPTPNNSPTGSISGLAASKYATSAKTDTIPTGPSQSGGRHTKRQSLAPAKIETLARNHKEKHDTLRRTEKRGKNDRHLSMAKQNGLRVEKERAEKAENEVRALKAKLAMNKMERRNAISEKSDCGDVANIDVGEAAGTGDFLNT